MTIEDDLATLRAALVYNPGDYGEVVDRVEAEIVRLETQRSTLQITRDQLAQLREAAKAREARLRAGLWALADEAESYIGIGFDTANESARLMEAVREARILLAENARDSREPDGYRTEGGRVIPTDR